MNLEDLFSTTLPIVVGLATLAGWAALGEGLRRVGVRAAVARRVVHVMVGLTVAGAPLVLDSTVPLYVLAVVFVATNAVARSHNLLSGMHEARPSSLGTVLFPLAVLPALALTWSVEEARIPAFQIAFLILAVADPVASWVGTRSDLHSAGSHAEKTVRGSLAFAMAATFVAGTGWIALGPPVPLASVLVMAVSVTLVTTAAEALGKDGWDNLFIVLAAVGVLVPWTAAPTSWLVPGAVAAGGGFALLAYRMRLLTGDGALAGGLLAVSLIAWVPPAWMAPALAFFVLSSALSYAGRRRKHQASAKAAKGARRDAEQVVANGGVAWILLGLSLALPLEVVGPGVLGAFAAAAADTWATELGTAVPGRPLSLRSWRRVPPGTSGAISLFGTFASVLGAASVGLAAWAVGIVPLPEMGVVILAGTAGAFADSVAGATLQAQYRNPVTGEISERRPVHSNRPVHGYAMINNEVVNALGTATGACLAILLAAG